jgi:MSHA pilin protein MshA
MGGVSMARASRSRTTADARGFTLIELIMVLTVISVLAAVALPRFASLQADARMDKVNAAAGAAKSAAVMGRALLLARGYPDNFTGLASAPPLAVEGMLLEFVNGYPAATVIAELAGLAGNSLTRGSFVVLPASGGRRTVQADPDRSGCAFSYLEAGPGQAPTFTVSSSLEACG